MRYDHFVSSVSTSREMVLDYRLRWMGLIPLACWIFQATYYSFVVERPAALLWMCHVTALMLAVGLIGSFASLIRLVAGWTVLGLPIWIVDAMSVGATRISVLSHLAVPAVALVAMSQVGVGRSIAKMTIASFGFYVVLQLFCRAATPPDLNVNLAHAIYPFFGQGVVESYGIYWGITAVLNVAALHGIHALMARQFSVVPLASLLDERVVAVGGAGDDVVLTAPPEPRVAEAPKPKTKPAVKTGAALVRGKTAAELRAAMLLDEEPEAPPPPPMPPPSSTPRKEWIPPKLRARGFTLLEMMVVVGLLGLLAAIAVPDLTPAIHNARLRAAGDDVVSILERARRSARAEGRCYRVRVDGGALVMDRRTHADCFTTSLLSGDWEQVATSGVPINGVSYDIETLPIDAPIEARQIIFRPNGRLRGDGDLDVEDDGARVYITSERMGPVGMDIAITSFGRLCARRVPERPAPLTTGPLVCGFGFLAGGTPLDGGSGPPVPSPTPSPGPGPGPSPGPGPGPSPGPGPGPTPGPFPFPTPTPTPPPSPSPPPIGGGGGSLC